MSKENKTLKINGVFNLSSVQLSQGEQRVLRQGLKFEPPQRLNKFETFIDDHNFFWKINIKRHFLLNLISNRSSVVPRGTPQLIAKNPTSISNSKSINQEAESPLNDSSGVNNAVASSILVFKKW